MASISTNTQDLRSRMAATARAAMSAFEEASDTNNPSLINRDFTPTCNRYFMPASLQAAFGLPADFATDNPTFEDRFAKDLKAQRFKNNVVSNLVIDTEAMAASFTARAEVRPFVGEPWHYEQAVFVWFNEDGTKIKKLVDFCDKEGIMKMAAAQAV